MKRFCTLIVLLSLFFLSGCAADKQEEAKIQKPISSQEEIEVLPERDPEEELKDAVIEIESGREYLTGEWGVDTPENHGIAQEALDHFREVVTDSPVLSAVIVQEGSLIYEYYKEGYDAGSRFHLYSGTKSIMSALVGIALEQEYLDSIDTPIGIYFPELEDEQMKTITIAQLLSQTSGIDWSEFPQEGPSGDVLVEWLLADDQVGYILGRGMQYPPGEMFNYSSGNAHLISAILTRVLGESADEYARRNLFEPIGVKDYTWWHDSQGIAYGGWGISLTAREAARFGQLYLNEGKWGDQQIVPEEWVHASTEQKSEGRADSEVYGYNWWINVPEEGQDYRMYYASGYGGQYIFVVPDYQLVAVVTGDINESFDVMKSFKQFLKYMR